MTNNVTFIITLQGPYNNLYTQQDFYQFKVYKFIIIIDFLMNFKADQNFVKSNGLQLTIWQLKVYVFTK